MMIYDIGFIAFPQTTWIFPSMSDGACRRAAITLWRIKTVYMIYRSFERLYCTCIWMLRMWTTISNVTVALYSSSTNVWSLHLACKRWFQSSFRFNTTEYQPVETIHSCSKTSFKPSLKSWVFAYLKYSSLSPPRSSRTKLLNSPWLCRRR